MLRFAIIAAALVPSLAMAQAYGNQDTCGLYAAGGSNAVVGLGVGVPNWNGPSDDQMSTYLLVTPKEVLGAEWGCHRTGNDLSCSGEGDEWTEKVSIETNGDLLSYTDERGTITLHRCAFREALVPN